MLYDTGSYHTMYILHTYHRYIPEIAREKHLEDAISKKKMDLFSSNCYEYQPWTLGQLYHPKSTPYYFTLSFFFRFLMYVYNIHTYIYIYKYNSIIFRQNPPCKKQTIKCLTVWYPPISRCFSYIFLRFPRFPMTFPSKFGSVYPKPAGHWPTLHPLGPVPRSQKLPRNYSDDCGPHVATARCPAKSMGKIMGHPRTCPGGFSTWENHHYPLVMTNVAIENGHL